MRFSTTETAAAPADIDEGALAGLLQDPAGHRAARRVARRHYPRRCGGHGDVLQFGGRRH